MSYGPTPDLLIWDIAAYTAGGRQYKACTTSRRRHRRSLACASSHMRGTVGASLLCPMPRVQVWFPRKVWGAYGRKSADRTEPHFGVIFFVFLSTFFGNLEVCDVKTCNIFWKYMSATWSTCLCLDHYFIGGLFNCPYILPFLKKLFCFKTIFKAFCCQFLDFSVIL